MSSITPSPSSPNTTTAGVVGQYQPEISLEDGSRFTMHCQILRFNPDPRFQAMSKLCKSFFGGSNNSSNATRDDSSEARNKTNQGNSSFSSSSSLMGNRNNSSSNGGGNNSNNNVSSSPSKFLGSDESNNPSSSAGISLVFPAPSKILSSLNNNKSNGNNAEIGNVVNSSSSSAGAPTPLRPSTFLNTNNYALHTVLDGLLTPAVVGRKKPDEFMNLIRNVLENSTEYGDATRIWRHIQSCCVNRTHTDAVGIIVLKESVTNGVPKQEPIGGTILLLVENSREYFRQVVDMPTPANNNSSALSSPLANSAIMTMTINLTRIWIPWFCVSKFPQYDQSVLAVRLLRNILQIVGKLKSQNGGFGHALTGIDVRSPHSSVSKKVFKGNFKFVKNKQMDQSLVFDFEPTPASSSAPGLKKKNDSKGQAVAVARTKSPIVKTNNTNNKRTTSASSRKKQVKDDDSTTSSSSSDSEDDDGDDEKTVRSKNRTASSQAKMNSRPQNAKDKKLQTDVAAATTESGTPDTPTTTSAPDAHSFSPTDRLCPTLPDCVKFGHVKFRLAHDDDQRDWNTVFTTFAVRNGYDASGLNTIGFESDLRLIAYFDLKSGIDKEKMSENGDGDSSGSSSSSNDDDEDDDILQDAKLQEDSSSASQLRSKKFKSAAQFTPTQEYINRYETQNHPDRACSIIDKERNRKQRSATNTNKNNRSNDNKSLQRQQILHQTFRSYGLEDDYKIHNNNNSNKSNNNGSDSDQTIIVGLISMTRSGFVPFVWVHDKLRCKGLGRILFAIAAEWLRVRQLIITYADKSDAYSQGKTEILKHPLTWIPFGERWNLSVASCSNSSSSSSLSPEMQHLFRQIEEERKKNNKFASHNEEDNNNKNGNHHVSILPSATKPKILVQNNKNNAKKNDKNHGDDARALKTSKNNNNDDSHETFFVPPSTANGNANLLSNNSKQAQSSNNNNNNNNNNSFASTLRISIQRIPAFCAKLLFGGRTFENKNNNNASSATTAKKNSTATSNNNSSVNQAKCIKAPKSTSHQGTSSAKIQKLKQQINENNSKNANAVDAAQQQKINPSHLHHHPKCYSAISTTSPNENDIAFMKSRLVTRFSLAADYENLYRFANDPFVSKERKSDENPSGPHETCWIPCSVAGNFEETFGGINDCHATKFPTEQELLTHYGIRKLVMIEKVFLLSCLKQVLSKKFLMNNNNNGFASSSSSSPTCSQQNSNSSILHRRQKIPLVTIDLDPIPVSKILSSSLVGGIRNDSRGIVTKPDRTGHVLVPEYLDYLDINLKVLKKENLNFYGKLKFYVDGSTVKNNNSEELVVVPVAAASATSSNSNNSKKKDNNNNNSSVIKIVKTSLDPEKEEVALRRTIQLNVPQLPCCLGELVPQLDFDFLSLLIPEWREKKQQQQQQQEQEKQQNNNNNNMMMMMSSSAANESEIQEKSGRIRTRSS